MDKIDWSAFHAAHGPASLSIEVEGKSQGFMKRLFSGPPPKEKVGNIPELLNGLANAKDEVEAMSKYRYLAPSLCGNEFVTEAAQPAFPFLMDCLEEALDSNRLKLADNLLELFTAMAFNCYRNAVYPKGDWADEFFASMKAEIERIKSMVSNQELEESKSRLIAILDKEPVDVYELSQKIEWLNEGEIRFLSNDREEDLEAELQKLSFKTYRVDAGNVEMDEELAGLIGQELLLATAQDIEIQPEYINAVVLRELTHEQFQPPDCNHVAIFVKELGISLAYSNNRQALMAEIEELIIAVQRREEKIIGSANQIEFFFFLPPESLSELAGEGKEKSEDCFCFEPVDAEYFRSRAYREVDKGSLDSAIKFYSKAIELLPDDYGLLRERAQLYRLLGSYAEAVDDCTRAIDLNEFSLAHCERARSYLELKEFDNAIRDCEEELERARDDEADSWVPHHLIARALFEKSAFEEALKYCNQSIKIAVTREAYELRALIHEKLGDNESSIQDQERAKTTKAGNPGVL